MSQESKTAKKDNAATDYDEVVAQLSALREDMAKLAQTVTGIAERRGRGLATDIAEGVSEATDYVERRGHSAEAELERTVAAHPFVSLGLAAAAGLLVGALSRR